jgi:hypothetical protein
LIAWTLALSLSEDLWPDFFKGALFAMFFKYALGRVFYLPLPAERLTITAG